MPSSESGSGWVRHQRQLASTVVVGAANPCSGGVFRCRMWRNAEASRESACFQVASVSGSSCSPYRENECGHLSCAAAGA